MEDQMMPQTLTYEDIVDRVRDIVEETPGFIYPQQAEAGTDPRCTCIEVDVDEDENGDYLGEAYIYADCNWHMDDDNTCRYVKEDDSPACVIGHYFVKELGFDDLYNFEAKSPVFILNAKGIDVDERGQRFLNMIQSQQDQGWEWSEAFNTAVKSAENQPTEDRFV